MMRREREINGERRSVEEREKSSSGQDEDIEGKILAGVEEATRRDHEDCRLDSSHNDGENRSVRMTQHRGRQVRWYQEIKEEGWMKGVEKLCGDPCEREQDQKLEVT
eukprot:296368-Hanusia_phi.AAC.1